MSGGVRLDVGDAVSRHAGLFLDKFILEDDGKGRGERLIRIADQKMDGSIYRHAFQRWRSHWQREENTVCVTGAVRGRMVTGLGAESVLENGLRLNHTYGTPVIPGSTIKGVLWKSMPEAHCKPEKGSYRWYLFGDENHKGAAQFEDAWWDPGSPGGKPLALDVLTPHHSDYMDGKGPPTDFDEPVPVPFLSVAAKQRFLFVIGAPTEPWKQYLHGLLKDVLANEGVGAKRSAGYGVFEVD